MRHWLHHHLDMSCADMNFYLIDHHFLDYLSIMEKKKKSEILELVLFWKEVSHQLPNLALPLAVLAAECERLVKHIQGLKPGVTGSQPWQFIQNNLGQFYRSDLGCMPMNYFQMRQQQRQPNKLVPIATHTI